MFAMMTRGGLDARLRERRRIFVAIFGSLLVHVLLLFVTIKERMDTSTPQGGAVQGPITVRLARPAAPSHPPVAAVPNPPRSQPARNKRAVIALHKPAPFSRPAREPLTPPAETSSPDAPTDMMSMVQSARERRQAAEDAAARENAAAQAAERGPSPEDIAMANIKHSLQSAKNDGTGGVFQILSKGVRTGSFVFRGWTPGVRSTSQQTFEVDAGPGGDVELALVRKMIELIRKHYTGDFNWESYRLGRVVVMSARPQDSAQLEAFLMQEFFPDEVQAHR
jgi:hypothetical protein